MKCEELLDLKIFRSLNLLVSCKRNVNIAFFLISQNGMEKSSLWLNLFCFLQLLLWKLFYKVLKNRYSKALPPRRHQRSQVQICTKRLSGIRAPGPLVKTLLCYKILEIGLNIEGVQNFKSCSFRKKAKKCPFWQYRTLPWYSRLGPGNGFPKLLSLGNVATFQHLRYYHLTCSWQSLICCWSNGKSHKILAILK